MPDPVGMYVYGISTEEAIKNTELTKDILA
jgi:hypothetical protein